MNKSYLVASAIAGVAVLWGRFRNSFFAQK